MNTLLKEINRSIVELDKGLAGKLTMSEKMERLLNFLNDEKVPETWNELCYPSKRSLASWFINLKARYEQLNTWKDEPVNIPKVTRINYLFNPSSFLTAIKQVKRKAELNLLHIVTEFQKFSIEEVKTEAKDGAYAYGFLLDGAAWEENAGVMEDARPLKMYTTMPVCLCRSEKINPNMDKNQGFYKCPVYRTEMRGPTYIFTA